MNKKINAEILGSGLGKIFSNINIMNKVELEKLSKSQLINLILQQIKKTIKGKPIPTPGRSVKQMVQDYEQNIIQPPIECQDKPIPAPRSKKIQPIPLPRTILKETNKALKGYTTSYEISIKNNKDPLIQLQNTQKAIEIHFEKILNEMKGLKFIETLNVTFEKHSGNEKIIKSAYFNSKAQTIIHKTQIEPALKLSKQQILLTISRNP